MGATNRKSIDSVERGQRLAESGKLPPDGGSRRSDRIRAIAQNIVEDGSEDDALEFFWNIPAEDEELV